MNDLYIHQLETENKQLREVLKINHQIIDMYVEKIDKAINYIKNKQEDINNGGNDMSYRQLTALLEILDVLGDKENE